MWSRLRAAMKREQGSGTENIECAGTCDFDRLLLSNDYQGSNYSGPPGSALYILWKNSELRIHFSRVYTVQAIKIKVVLNSYPRKIK